MGVGVADDVAVLAQLSFQDHRRTRAAGTGAGERDAYPLADRLRGFTREHENVGQKSFDALVHRVRLCDRQSHVARLVTSGVACPL